MQSVRVFYLRGESCIILCTAHCTHIKLNKECFKTFFTFPTLLIQKWFQTKIANSQHQVLHVFTLWRLCSFSTITAAPHTNFNYSHKRTMTSLCVLGQTKSHWLIQSMCPLNICPPKTSKQENFLAIKENGNVALPC